MKAFRTLVAIFLAGITTHPATVAAQPPRPAARPAAPMPAAPVPATLLAVYYGAAFDEPGTGIHRLANAIQDVEREFQPVRTQLNEMYARLRAIENQLSPSVGTSGRPEDRPLVAEHARLSVEFRRLTEGAIEARERRMAEVTGTIRARIALALEGFARERGITILFNLEGGDRVTVVAPGTDITRAFIADYNARNP